jgi:hypothetical protein
MILNYLKMTFLRFFFYKPLHGSIMQHLFGSYIFLKINWFVNHDFRENFA